MSGREHGPANDEVDPGSEPARWSDARPADDRPGRMGAGFRALAAAPVPAEQAPTWAARSPRARQPRSRFALAAVVLAVVALGGALAAAKVYRRLVAPAAPARAMTATVAEARERVHARSAQPATEPSLAPAPAAPISLVDVEADGGEAALMAQAFRNLRGEHAPARALALVDEHDRRFPHGQLAEEAAEARIEALLALGRRAEVLAALDRDARGTSGERASERALLRGELRAGAGRCADAIVDFARAERGAVAELTARAVWGQAACRARLGDTAGARRDFARYLTTFPAGPAAPDARRWLAAHDHDTTGARSGATGIRTIRSKTKIDEPRARH